MKKRSYIRFAIGIAVSAVLVIVSLRLLDFHAVAAVVSRANVMLLLAGVAALAMGYIVRSVRWCVMLRSTGNRTRLRDAAMVLVAGFAGNNVLPFRAGDFVRAGCFTKRMQASAPALLGSLAFERALDLFSLVAISLVLSVVSRVTLPIAGMLKAVAVLSAFAAAGLIAVLLFARPIERLMLRMVAAMVHDEQRRAKLQQIVSSLLLVFTTATPGVTATLLLLSLLSWGLEGFVFVAAMHSLGISAAPEVPWLAFVTANMFTLIPSAPGYVGTFDLAAAAALVAGGVDRTAAAGFAVLVHAALWLPITLAGGICFLLLQREQCATEVRVEELTEIQA